MNNSQTHYRTCNLCEAMCGLVIQHDGQRVLNIKGDKYDPFSHGHICPKATALQDVYEDPDRLRQPMRRTAAGDWEPISWDEAFAEAVAGIQRVQAAHGTAALAVYQGNPNVHNTGTMLFSPPFVRSLRTPNRFSATSVDQLPHHYAAYFMLGHQFLIPIPDIDHTQFMLILGANPLASNGSLMTAAGVENRLKAIQKRGGKVVLVDPRTTETAELADAHHFIRPGTDALLLFALIHTLFDEGLVDLGRLAAFTSGVGQMGELAAEFTPERVAPHVGIAPAAIRQLARDFAAAESAVAYGRVGTSMQPFGGLATWLINALNILTGNFDRRGGAMFPTPAIDVVGILTALGNKGSHGRWRTRVRGLPEFGGELPSSALAEEMLTPGEGQIKGLVTIAGNPVLSTPNGRQLDEALAGLEFMLAIDIYINETTRHAHLILPPTTGLENPHYDLVFHNFAVRNTAKYSPALFPPPAGQLADWQILHELRLRLAGPSKKRRRDLHQRNTPPQLLDLALRVGPHKLKLRYLQANPHGVDLGPLEPCLPERLATADGRIQLCPAVQLGDLPRLRALLDAPAEAGLRLIGRRDLRSNNSWMHNSQRLVKGKPRCTVWMHPQDAAEQGLADGQTVRVRSRVGEVELPLEITAKIMPHVISIPHGWGHGRKGVRLQVAQAHAGVSINDLTDDQVVDALTGNAAFSGVAVEVLSAEC